MERNNSEEELWYHMSIMANDCSVNYGYTILSVLLICESLTELLVLHTVVVSHIGLQEVPKKRPQFVRKVRRKTQLGRWHKSLFQFDNDLHGMITFNGYSPNRVKQSIISTAKKQTEFSIKYQSLDTCFSSQLCKGQVSTTAKWRWHAATPLKWLL